MRSEMTQLIYFNLGSFYVYFVAVNKISLLKGMELCKWHKVKVINLSKSPSNHRQKLNFKHGAFMSWRLS